MSKESYVRGFCKAAEAAGVDPKALVKYAQNGGGWFRDGPTVQRGWYEDGVAAAKKNPESVYRQIPGRKKNPFSESSPFFGLVQNGLDQQALRNHIDNNFLERPSFWRGFAGVKMPETFLEKELFRRNVDMWRRRAQSALGRARTAMLEEPSLSYKKSK